MIKPLELDNEQGQAIWETMCAADAGDTAGLKGLLDKDPGLSRSEYWYQHPLHYAVRGGHLEAVKLLLDAGGDPEWNAYDGKRWRGTAGMKKSPNCSMAHAKNAAASLPTPITRFTI